jgi:hypothetical protein
MTGRLPDLSASWIPSDCEIHRMHAAVLNTKRRKRLCTANRRAATSPVSVSGGGFRKPRSELIGQTKLVFSALQQFVETGWMRSATTHLYVVPSELFQDKQIEAFSSGVADGGSRICLAGDFR